MSAAEQRPGEFGAGYWEDRYRAGEGAGRSDPSPTLVTEAGGLRPGTAVDAGCGRGADALWLAASGWRVTAVDVSAAALEHAEQAARAAGPEVAGRLTWVHADLAAWAPGVQADLVTSHFVHAPGPAEDLFRRLASWVAPGGTLLVVGHGEAQSEAHGHGHDHGHGHAHPPGALVRPEQVTGVLPAGEWEVVVAGPRTSAVRRPGSPGAAVRHDVVVRARRTAPAS